MSEIIPSSFSSVEQQPSRETVVVQSEFDLGHHTLFLLSDGSIDLLLNDETHSLAENVLSLDPEETYRLFISLQEQFTHGVHHPVSPVQQKDIK